jgi:hypothetical protein
MCGKPADEGRHAMTLIAMTYQTEFPHYASPIPDVFLSPPWEDASWHNDSCPCFSRKIGPADEQVHVYVDEANPRLRDYWTTEGGLQSPLPRYTVRFTDEEGAYPERGEDPRDFSTDSLANLLDRIGFITGEVSR